jgi:hypothetical protein
MQLPKLAWVEITAPEGGNCGTPAKTITTGGQDVQIIGVSMLSNLKITGSRVKITSVGGTGAVTTICTIISKV